MNIDHIFIFTDDQGKVADELIGFGLLEGSSRVHVGQGTTNRKFYFLNFFLEILWVYDENEIKSKQTKQAGLWQRADYKTNSFSPFGLCLVNSKETEKLFEKALKYHSDYFPKGMAIDIIKNDKNPDLPWTFQLPVKGQKNIDDEPRNHPNGIEILSKAVYEYRNSLDDKYLENFKEVEQIEFIKSSRNWLRLIFDNGKQDKAKDFQRLNMTIEY
ncbi:hypothetical protein AAGF08_16425 [Algoriphagus sp. SE2]|uniref:hypothetical protein n=1 Tax=Algoriphagus sp. SE2 TaxID=3141536 RepID=UPI0031CD6824